MSCHYLYLSGHAHYKVNTEETVEEGEIKHDSPALIRVGNCAYHCEGKMQLVISGDSGDQYVAFNNNEVIEEETFTKPTLKSKCIESDNCFKLGGAVAYSMLKNNYSNFEKGSA